MALRTHPQVQPFKQHVILSSAARFFDLQENWSENVGNVFPKNISQNASASCLPTVLKFYKNKHRLAKLKSQNLGVHEAGNISNYIRSPTNRIHPKKVSCFLFVFHSRKSTSSPREYLLHPGRLTWKLQITHSERKMIFQTSMIMFHVTLPGCKKYRCHMEGPMSLIKPKTKGRTSRSDSTGEHPRIEPPKKNLRYVPLYYSRFFKEGSLSWFIVMPISLCSIYSPLYSK